MHDLGRVVPQGCGDPGGAGDRDQLRSPGAVRAVVSRDVRGFDGAPGPDPARLEADRPVQVAAAIGQTRAFVIWSRIITPTGVTIDVGSPATDRLGRGGLDGAADTHFFQRFGVLDPACAGQRRGRGACATAPPATTATPRWSSARPPRPTSSPTSPCRSRSTSPTTIRVPQGAPVQVSVARDLDFSGVCGAPRDDRRRLPRRLSRAAGARGCPGRTSPTS